ncbi:hypothetical protein LCGC14_0419770, partial [marine sediment metagenome]
QRGIVAAMLLHHPHGSFTDFRGKLVCLVHGFIFSGVEASAKPGAVQIPISKFFDAKAGIRIDTPEGPDRTYAVLGVSGLAPQWFEIDANFYVSKDGDTSAELDAEYELLLTNYWILSATLDATVAFSEDREIGVGKGLVSTETGLRLSYDLIDRAFSPYVGIVHERNYGDTADFAKADGGSTDDWFAVVGARLSF